MGFIKTYMSTGLDWFIVIAGVVMIMLHIACISCARKNLFYMKTWEKIRLGLLYFCEFFPLMGLTGTILSLIKTLNSMGPGQEIGVVIQNFSPALTTTLWGLVFLMFNLGLNFVLSLRIAE